MFATIEEALVGCGHVGSAERIQNAARIFEVFYRSSGKQKKWINTHIKHVWEYMTVILAEVASSQRVRELEKIQKPNGALTEEEKETLESKQNRVKQLHKKAWFYVRDIHADSFDKPKGSHIRRFQLFEDRSLSTQRRR